MLKVRGCGVESLAVTRPVRTPRSSVCPCSSVRNPKHPLSANAPVRDEGAALSRRQTSSRRQQATFCQQSTSLGVEIELVGRDPAVAPAFRCQEVGKRRRRRELG